MKRNVIAMLIAASAVFAVACGGTAPNANNSNLNRNTAVLAPNTNMTPVVVPNVNTGTAPVNGNKMAATTTRTEPGPAEARGREDEGFERRRQNGRKRERSEGHRAPAGNPEKTVGY